LFNVVENHEILDLARGEQKPLGCFVQRTIVKHSAKRTFTVARLADPEEESVTDTLYAVKVSSRIRVGPL
jgi:hypothetical protein